MSVLIRSASETINNSSIVFFRNFYSLLLLIPFISVKVWFSSLDHPGIIRLHFIRSITGLAAMYCFFLAIAELKLSTAMIFPYSASLFIPVIAFCWLKEKTNVPTLFYIGLGFIGVLLVIRPDQTIINWIALLGLISSFLTAMAMVAIRLLGRTESAQHIAFSFTLISTIISLPFYLLDYQPINLQQHILLLGIGMLASIAQLALSRAYSIAQAGSIAVIPYTAIIFAGIWAYFLWQEIPTLGDITGIALIIMASLLTVLLHHRNSKKAQEKMAILD